MKQDLDKVYDVDSEEYELVMNECWDVNHSKPEDYEKCSDCGGIAVIYPATTEGIDDVEYDTVHIRFYPKYVECVELQLLDDGSVDDNAGINGFGCGWRMDFRLEE